MPVRSASVGDVLDALGGTGVSLLSSPGTRDLGVRQSVLHDPHRPLPETPGGVLLLVGLEVDDDRSMAALRDADRHHFAAVAVKLHDRQADALVELADRCGVALIALQDALDWLHFSTLLGAVLDAAHESGLGVDAPDVGDLFALSNAVAAATGGATTIEDFQQRVLAYSNVPDQAIDEERREGILGRQVPENPGNDEQYRALYRAPGVVRFPASPGGLPRVAVAVRAGNELLGSIWVVEAEGSRTPGADQSLVSAAEVAGLHLLRARSAQDLARQHRDELVRQLFDGTLDPGSAISRLGLDRNGPYAVLAFGRLTSSSASPFRILDLLTLHVESRLGRAGFVLLGDTAYALVSGPGLVDPADVEPLCHDVVSIAKTSLKVDLVAGIGPVAHSAREIAHSRAEADRVLQLLAEDPSQGPVRTAGRVADQLAIMGLGQALVADPSLGSGRVAAVRAYDAEHGTSYLEALATYLDSQRDVTGTAARLSTHANTVRYRLRRARELFGIDLDDPDAVLVLWLTLRSSRTAGGLRPRTAASGRGTP